MNLTHCNTLIIEGFSGKEAIHLDKIIASQRRIYKSKSLEWWIAFDEERDLDNRIATSKKNEFQSYRSKVVRLTKLNVKNLPEFNSHDPNIYHIDHIVPCWYGFKNKIPPEVIASVMNLQVIPAQENMRKGAKMTNKSKEVLKKLIEFQQWTRL